MLSTSLISSQSSMSLSKVLPKVGALVLAGMILVGLSGCAPEVGSDKWCQQMTDKPKGDWTANQATDYAKHCMFK